MPQALKPDDLAEKVEEITTRVSTNLVNELKAQRWSQRAAATALGLSHRYVNSRATGDVEMSASDLNLFAEFLNIPIARFFDEPNLNNGNVVSINSKKANALGMIRKLRPSNPLVALPPIVNLNEYRQTRGA